MLPFRIRGMILVHNLLLSLAAAGLFWLWIVTHFVVFRATDIEWVRYGSYSLVVIAALAIDFVVSQLRGTDILQLDLRAALKLSLRQTITTLLAVLTFLVFFKDHGMSRLFLLTFVPILYALLLFLNVVVPPVLARILFLTKRREQTLLVGSGEQARRLLDWCKGKTLYGLDVIGLVTDHQADELHDFPIFGRVEDLEEVVIKSGATQLIALNSLSSQERSGISALSEKLGVRLLLVSYGGDHVVGNGTFTEGGFHFFSPREEPLECPFNRIIKKALDVTLSIPIVLLVLPPLALFVHIVHRFQSPGPLFFRQKRTGINYKTFWIYKFRTMHVNHGTDEQQATAHDPRVFTFGRWLRKLSIDELPQFLNVLKGEMSIVGPRPHMVEHTELFVKVASEFHIRTLVKPGITGLAQVRGFRGETATKEDVLLRVASDVYYLEHWSPMLEGSIILRTILHLVRPPKSAC